MTTTKKAMLKWDEKNHRLLAAGVVPLTKTTSTEIFESPHLKGVYGYVDLGVFPFRIFVNSHTLTPRKMIALVHEMLHVWAKLYKVPIKHQDLHHLSIFIMGELIPAYQRVHQILAERAKNERS